MGCTKLHKGQIGGQWDKKNVSKAKWTNKNTKKKNAKSNKKGHLSRLKEQHETWKKHMARQQNA